MIGGGGKRLFVEIGRNRIMILWSFPKFKKNKHEKDESFLELPHREQPQLFSSVLHKPLWEWLKLLLGPGLIIGFIGFFITSSQDKIANQKYNAQLVENYIESVKTLILDDYHHGKTAKSPEILVEEVEAFVRAKTGNTLKALNKSESQPQLWSQYPIFWLSSLWKQMSQLLFLPDQPTEKQNLVNFLLESGIGFFPPDQVEDTYLDSIIQNVCTKKETLGHQPKSQPKDYTFHHFFCGLNLQGVDLSNVELNRVILENANLEGAKLSSAKLYLADLEHTNLNNVDLSNANLAKANLKDATITEATLDNALLSQANLRRAWLAMEIDDLQVENIQKTSLKGANLSGANLQDTKLGGVDLSNANMSFFDLKYERDDPETGQKNQITRRILTNLRGSNLTGADLQGTDLRYANLRGADLSDVTINEKTDLTGAIYDEKITLPDQFADKEQEMIKITQDFHPSNKVDLSEVDLREAKLNKATLKGINLSRADLRGADLSGATIDQNTQLTGALYNDKTQLSPELEARKGEMIKLKEVDLNKDQKVDCKKTEKTDLTGKDLSYRDLSSVDLSCTKLQDADLTNIEFDENTRFTGAEYDDDTKLSFNRNTALRYGMRYAPHGRTSDNHPVDWSGQNHQQIDLRQAILKDADFTGTIFTEAKLENADLTRAELQGADLTGAKLQRGDLTEADLTDANLTDADLRLATLKDVKNLDKAILCRTLLSNDNTLHREAINRDCPSPSHNSQLD